MGAKKTLGHVVRSFWPWGLRSPPGTWSTSGGEQISRYRHTARDAGSTQIGPPAGRGRPVVGSGYGPQRTPITAARLRSLSGVATPERVTSRVRRTAAGSWRQGVRTRQVSPDRLASRTRFLWCAKRVHRRQIPRAYVRTGRATVGAPHEPGRRYPGGADGRFASEPGGVRNRRKPGRIATRSNEARARQGRRTPRARPCDTTGCHLYQRADDQRLSHWQQQLAERAGVDANETIARLLRGCPLPALPQNRPGSATY